MALPLHRYHVIAGDVINVAMVSVGAWERDPRVEAFIDDYLAENPVAFNGTSLRLESYDYSPSERGLTLAVSFSRYGDYVATNLNPSFRYVFPPEFWQNTIVLGALPRTVDGKLFLNRRPMDAQQSPGRIDLPCGHPSELEVVPLGVGIKLTEGVGLDYVVNKEVGCAVNYLRRIPLLFMYEEPHRGYNYISIVQLLDTSEMIEATSNNPRKFFINDDPDEISRFIGEAPLCSPPVLPTLLYYGRKKYGDGWFSKHF